MSNRGQPRGNEGAVIFLGAFGVAEMRRRIPAQRLPRQHRRQRKVASRALAFGPSFDDLGVVDVARLDHLPEKPAHEFWVAIAGPLVNVALAILFSLYLFRFTPDQRWEIMNGVVFAKGNFFLSDYSNFDRFIFFMAWLNVILATFNLIPAFPMDGGRILRALLSIGLGRLNATMIAARIGQLLALGMITWGIQGLFER